MSDPAVGRSVIIVSMSDPLALSAGGITPVVIAHLRNADSFPPAMVGLQIEGKGPLGRWQKEQVQGKPFQFFPLLRVHSRYESKKRFPISPLFVLKLFRYRKPISELCGSLHVWRVELALPFVFGRRDYPIVVAISGSSRFLEMCIHHPYYKWPLVRWLYLQMEKYVLKRVDAVTTVSEDAYHDYSRRLPFLKGRLSMIPPPVDTDLFRPREKVVLRERLGLPTGQRLLVYAGRFVPEKRVDALIESLHRVRSSVPDVALVLVGDGPEKGRLEKIMPSDGSVVLMGGLGREQVAEVLSACDVAVLFSMFEGMSIFVLESLASGLPVVSTQVGDIPKVVVNGLTGFIVNPPQVESFAAAIIRAIEISTSVAENCRRVAMNYSPAAITRRVEELHIMLREKYKRV